MSNNKKDGPLDPKRPHATLDLKATDLTPQPEAEAKAAETMPSSSSVPETGKPSDTRVPDNKGAADSKASDTKTASAGSKPEDRKAPNGAPHSAPATKPAVERGRGGLFSHLLAGIAGGVLAFAIADWAAPRLGIATQTQDLQARTGELQQRLANVEKSATASELAAKLQAAEQRLASLEGKADTLGTAQTQLASETKEAVGKLSTNTLDADTQQRLSALDERLATIVKGIQVEPGTSNVALLTTVSDKLAELQASFGKDVEAVRQSIPKDADVRLNELAKQAQTAKAGTQRADEDIKSIRTDAARLSQRFETLKADGDRAGATLKVLQEETAQLSSGFADLRTTVASQVKGGVGEAITPVAKKLSALEEGLESVVKSEADRRANAERIVVSLELANLKRLIDSGQNYAGSLAEVRKAAGGKLDMDALERFKDSGVPTIAELQQSFRSVANGVIDAATAPTEGGVFDKLMAGAKSVVRVRNLNPSPSDKSAEATVARMQTALADGQLGDVLAYANDIPASASAGAQDWLANVKARHSVDHAIGEIEKQLKSSLTQAAATPAPSELAVEAPAPAVHLPNSIPIAPSEGRLPAPGSVRPSTPSPSQTVPSDSAQP